MTERGRQTNGHSASYLQFESKRLLAAVAASRKHNARHVQLCTHNTTFRYGAHFYDEDRAASANRDNLVFAAALTTRPAPYVISGDAHRMLITMKPSRMYDFCKARHATLG